MKKKLKLTTKTTENMCNVACSNGEDYLQASSSGRAGCRGVQPLQSVIVLLLLIGSCCCLSTASADPLKVVYAVNAGGEEHTDRNGITYEADPLKNVGIASDYGKHLLMIGRTHEHDEMLYRTERYHTTTFGYDFPTDGDGDYALIMKFCEVYFDAPGRKVFDVLLNRKHTVIRQLDIYEQVGRGSAHDEIVYFKINNGRLHYLGEVSDVRNGQLRLDFIKGALDNPKINAFALLKGDISQIPTSEASTRIGPEKPNQQGQQERVVRTQRDDIDEDDEDLDDLDELEEEMPEQHAPPPPPQQQQQQQQHQQQQIPQQPQQQQQRQEQSQSQTADSKRAFSGPRQPNPYSMDDSSILLPVFIAIGAFIPLLFCLCKL
ncbi:malectin [Drosophila guanche]|uniref:Blast:Malectin n=1 Tax=Drosophila guanche TaxID=7266 RepID=A0A3B0KEV8_DROGU|nr:malectin [Drosophila guanche]SPP82138.1 blast:Malectin [Drosophila guanche]